MTGNVVLGDARIEDLIEYLCVHGQAPAFPLALGSEGVLICDCIWFTFQAGLVSRQPAFSFKKSLNSPAKPPASIVRVPAVEHFDFVALYGVAGVAIFSPELHDGVNCRVRRNRLDSPRHAKAVPIHANDPADQPMLMPHAVQRTAGHSLHELGEGEAAGFRGYDGTHAASPPVGIWDL